MFSTKTEVRVAVEKLKSSARIRGTPLLLTLTPTLARRMNKMLWSARTMPTWSFVQVGLLLLVAAPAMTWAQNVNLASAPAGVTTTYVAVMTNKVGSISEIEGVRSCWVRSYLGGWHMGSR